MYRIQDKQKQNEISFSLSFFYSTPFSSDSCFLFSNVRHHMSCSFFFRLYFSTHINVLLVSHFLFARIGKATSYSFNEQLNNQSFLSFFFIRREKTHNQKTKKICSCPRGLCDHLHLLRVRVCNTFHSLFFSSSAFFLQKNNNNNH